MVFGVCEFRHNNRLVEAKLFFDFRPHLHVISFCHFKAMGIANIFLYPNEVTWKRALIMNLQKQQNEMLNFGFFFSDFFL